MATVTEKQTGSESILGSEKMGRLVLRMALPAVAAQLVNLLYSVVDRIFIGHIPEIGGSALTGVGLASPLIILIAAFASFVGGGGAPLASIALGKGDKKEAEKILSNGLTLLLFLSFLLPLLFFVFAKPLLYFVGASDDTFSYAFDYFTLYLVGTPMVLLTVGLTPFLTAQGRAKDSMAAVLIGAFTNILLDWLFVPVLGWHVKGAALATVIAQTAAAAFVFCKLISKKRSLRIQFSAMKPDFAVLGRMAALGISPFVMTSTESLIGLVMNSGLQQYGGDLYVGGLTVMQSVMQIISVPMAGFQQGVAPIISYNFGAGNRKRVKEAFFYIFTVMFSYTFLMTLLAMLFPSVAAGLFTDETAILVIVQKCMPLFLSGMLVFGIQRACQATFVALGQSGISLFIAILRKVILLVPLALIFPRFWGVEGIYLAEPVSDALAATTCGVIFFFRFRAILRQMKERERVSLVTFDKN